MKWMKKSTEKKKKEEKQVEKETEEQEIETTDTTELPDECSECGREGFTGRDKEYNTQWHRRLRLVIKLNREILCLDCC